MSRIFKGNMRPWTEDIITTIIDSVKDLEKEEADTILAKVSFTLQNSKT